MGTPGGIEFAGMLLREIFFRNLGLFSTGARKRNIKVVAAWRNGNVVGRINEVTLRRARLVLGWVTVFGGQTTSVFHQATQANSAFYPQREGK